MTRRAGKTIFACLGTTCVGGLAMLLLDPAAGRRRRAFLRGKAARFAHQARAGLRAGRRDLANRARGRLHDVGARANRAPIEDAVLEERVRAALGHVCSHPHDLEVHAHGGRVEIDGRVGRRELRRIVRAISRVSGVRELARTVH